MSFMSLKTLNTEKTIVHTFLIFLQTNKGDREIMN